MEKKILVLDEYNEAGNLMSILLWYWGYRNTSITCDVQAARKIIKKEDIDLFITNLGRSPADGEGLIREIKKSHPFIKIIVVSGAKEHRKETAKAAGAEYIFDKPFNHSALKKAIEKLLT